jgi:UDP-N-acetylglucosamine 1-carboxyvinyltransferase
MSKFIIKGRKKLHGEFEVVGAKNEATKVVAAATLTEEDVIVNNVPRILDLEKMLEIIRSMGGLAEWTGDHQIKLNCKEISPEKIDHKLVKKLRASVVLIGPLLARFGKIDFPVPGGCIIGNRPLDTHFKIFEKMGAIITEDSENNIYKIRAKKLMPTEIVLQEFSVTATENALMLASLVPGKSKIKIAATEPHTANLAKCLNKMGAKITGAGTHTIEIEGQEKLHGTEHAVIPDTIDAGTFAVLAAVTKSDVKIKNINPEHMDLFLLKLKEFGVNMEIGKDYLHIKPSGFLKSVKKIETNIYPGIPTDLQQPLTLLATQSEGTTLVFEKMFENRFGFVTALKEMGSDIEQLDPHRILITGPTALTGQEVKSYDLRAGATLVMAGLIADGETVINEAELVDRGYEDIVGRLKKLGADIRKQD